MPVIALNLQPFAFFDSPNHAPKVALKNGKVTHLCPKAAELGVTQGMPQTAVLLRAPDALLLEEHTPDLQRKWDDLLQEFYGFSPNVEALHMGLCLITGSEWDAHQLAHQYQARVGVGQTREQALIASGVAEPGKTRIVLDPEAFYQEASTTTLSLLGVSRDTVEKLAWLGITVLHDLKAWSRKQILHYFGEEAKPILGLFFERNVWVARFQLPREVQAEHTFFEPVQEPYQIDPVLMMLSKKLLDRLRGLQARKLILTATTDIGNLWSSRTIKDPIEKVSTLSHLLGLALKDSFATDFHVHKLNVRLRELYQLGEQKTLFQQKPRPMDAVRLVHQRFSGAMFHYQVHDPYSQARDQRFRKLPFDEEE